MFAATAVTISDSANENQIIFQGIDGGLLSGDLAFGHFQAESEVG